jgi:hypothetical protein
MVSLVTDFLWIVEHHVFEHLNIYTFEFVNPDITNWLKYFIALSLNCLNLDKKLLNIIVCR